MHASLAIWPGKHHVNAAQLAHAGAHECPWGVLSTHHLQLVPQSTGVLDEDLALSLRRAFPQTAFRLHANVRVQPGHVLADLSCVGEHWAWFEQAARVHQVLGASAYSAHAGRRANATLPEAFDNARRCADLFGSPVAIEGLYPEGKDQWLLSSWAEYAALLNADVPYALDLSHLNIVATHSRRVESSLVAELLASPRCLEIHVSDNDGVWDRHQHIRTHGEAPWWMALMNHAHPDAVIFSEASQHREIGTSRSTPSTDSMPDS